MIPLSAAPRTRYSFATGFLGLRCASPQALCCHLLRRFVDALTQIARTQAALKSLAKKTRSCRFATQRIRTKQNYAGSGGIQKEAVAAGYYNPKLKCVGGLRDLCRRKYRRSSRNVKF
jgi:hypothetical protein